ALVWRSRLAPRARCIPSPACGGGVGRGHGTKLERAFKTIHGHTLSPSPPSPASGGGSRPSSPLALIPLQTNALLASIRVPCPPLRPTSSPSSTGSASPTRR